MANTCKLIVGLFFALCCFGVYMLSNQVEMQSLKMKNLMKVAKLVVKEIDLTNPSTAAGLADTDIVSMNADFVMPVPLCATDTLKNSICGKCINIEQTVEMYQRVDVQTCTYGRKGKTITNEYVAQGGEMRLVKSNDDEKHAKTYQEMRNSGQCQTTTTYEWLEDESDDDNHSWHFPSSNDATWGTKLYENSVGNIIFMDMATNSVLKFLGSSHIQDLGITKTGSVSMSIWPITNFYQSGARASAEELCIAYSEATTWATKLANTQSGFNNSEFVQLPNYGNPVKYPHCEAVHPTMPTGTYKITATCNGAQSLDMRIIAGIQTVPGVTYKVLRPWTDEVGSTTFFMLWSQDGTKTTNEMIAAAQQQLAAVTQAVLQMCSYGMMGTGGLALISIFLGFIDKGDGSRSRKSSGSSD